MQHDHFFGIARQRLPRGEVEVFGSSGRVEIGDSRVRTKTGVHRHKKKSSFLPRYHFGSFHSAV